MCLPQTHFSFSGFNPKHELASFSPFPTTKAHKQPLMLLFPFFLFSHEIDAALQRIKKNKSLSKWSFVAIKKSSRQTGLNSCQMFPHRRQNSWRKNLFILFPRDQNDKKREKAKRLQK